MQKLTFTFAILTALLCATEAYAQKKIICLDPGHGGSDPGAVGCNLEEAAINLDTALKLKPMLEGANYTVIMTRTTDTSVTLASRVQYANSNNANRFVSIHANSAASVASGIETFCYTSGSSYSFDMRDKIQEEMIAAWPLPNRGGKTAGYYVLVNTNMPSTLTELGFINNCSVDAVYLGSSSHRSKAAEAHLRAIQRHFGETPTDPTDPDPKGFMKGAIFEDTGAGTSDMSIRLTGAVVRVVEKSVQTAAEGENALWSFELEPGEYTFRASHTGYITNERKCAVKAGTTEWCSIGLFKEGTDAGEADVPPTDTGIIDTGDDEDVPPTDTGIIDTGDDEDVPPPADTGIFDTGDDEDVPPADTGIIDTGDDEDVPPTDTGIIDTGVPGEDSGDDDDNDDFEDAGGIGEDSGGGETDGGAAIDSGSGEADAGSGGGGQDDPVNDDDNWFGDDDKTPAEGNEGEGSETKSGERVEIEQEGDSSGCSCRVTANKENTMTPGMILVSLSVFASIYKKISVNSLLALAAISTALTLVGCTKEQTAELERAVVEKEAQVKPATITAINAEPFAELRDIRLAVEGDYMAPVISPKGDSLLFSGPKYTGLFVKPIEGGEIKKLTEAPRAGFMPSWDKEGVRVAYRAAGQAINESPIMAVDIEGKEAAPFKISETIVLQKEDKIYLKKSGVEKLISTSDDRFYAPLVSPRERFVAYNGLSSGIYLYEIETGRTIIVGAGNNAAFAADESIMAFDRTQDDGKELTGGELYITDLRHPEFRTAPLTQTAEAIETHPSLSADGKKIAYSVGGKIFVAAIEFKE